jgi:putative pyruvate formate lyase activating enzyme
VNLMDQYFPAGRVSAEHYPEINRRLRAREFTAARDAAEQVGLTRLDSRRALARGGRET